MKRLLMRGGLKTRLLRGHSRKCNWTDQPWSSPWWNPGEVWKCNKAGWGKGHHRWLMFRCAAPNCGAEMLVSEDSISERLV